MSDRVRLKSVHPQIIEDQIGPCAFRLMMDREGTLVVDAPAIAWVVPAVASHARRDARGEPPEGTLWGVGSDRTGAYMGEWALMRTQTEALEHARKLLIQWDVVARLGVGREQLPMWWTRPADDARDAK